jgi:MoaA/NifB/PqqE/SkfB family radical SAM enzyme
MYPNSAFISTSDSCSINCSFCFRADVGNSTISMKTFTRTLSVLHQIGISQICLTGGEPTHHNRFPELIKVSSQFGILCSVVSAERRIHSFIGLDKLIPQITLSADTDELCKIGNKSRQIDASLENFMKDLTTLFSTKTSLSINITFFKVSFREINSIYLLLRKYPKIKLELSPLLPSDNVLKSLSISYEDYIKQIEEDIFMLSNVFEISQSLKSFIYGLSTFKQGSFCCLNSLYVSADGFIRRCPYNEDLQVNVFQSRSEITYFIDKVFGINPPTTKFYCQGICDNPYS